MRRRILILSVPFIILTLTLSFAAVLPARSQDTGPIITKLEKLSGMLENEHPSLENKVNAVIHQIKAGAFNGALNKLQNDVKKSIESKVENPAPLIVLVNEIIKYIEELLHPKPPKPDFHISAGPMELEVVQGGFSTSVITITSLNNFTQEVVLTSSSDAMGIILALDPSKVIPPPNGTIASTLRVEAASDAEPNQYEITVTGASGSITHSVTIELTVTASSPAEPDFSIAASPSTLTIQQGDSDTSIISVTSLQGFNQPVELEVTSAQITGVTTSLNPTQVIPPANLLAISALTIDVAGNAAASHYNITVTGNSGVLTHNTTIHLEVTAPPTPPSPDFSIGAAPTELTVEQGDSASSTVVVVSLRGFSQQVNLTITSQPIAHVTLALNPSQVTPAVNDFAASTLIVTVGKSATPSDNTITINGTSGTLTRTVNISLKIILETKPPEIVSLLKLIDNPAYNQSVRIVASVEDEISGVKEVILNYQYGSASKNVSMGMAIEQEEIYYTTYIPPLPFNTVVKYLVYASDNAGNWAKSSTHGYFVTDPYPPVIGVPTWSPREPAAEEDITINVTVTKPINASGLEGVTLWYKNKTRGDVWYLTPMTLQGGNWTATLSNQSDTVVEFFVRAVDKAGNSEESQTQEFTVAAPPGGIPLIWILAAIIVILAVTGAATAAYALRRRKKSTTTTQVPAA